MYCKIHGETSTIKSFGKWYKESGEKVEYLNIECVKCRQQDLKNKMIKEDRKRIFKELEKAAEV